MTILIADDDPLTLEALAACIADEGFQTLSAADGMQAIELWREHRPQLLCLDIMMPEIDGFEVCRRVRATDSAVPILFLSAKNEEIDVVVGLGLGADDFIRKPFTRAEIIAFIDTDCASLSTKEKLAWLVNFVRCLPEHAVVI
jgi:DNA-binding response OmpR family regulator